MAINIFLAELLKNLVGGQIYPPPNQNRVKYLTAKCYDILKVVQGSPVGIA